MCDEFNASDSKPTQDAEVKKLIALYKEDGEEKSPSYDMVDALPKFFAAVWNMSYWGFEKCLLTWTMLLVRVVSSLFKLTVFKLTIFNIYVQYVVSMCAC